MPVIAIFTKFDLFVVEHLQRLLKDHADDTDEVALEEEAKTLAMTTYETQLKGVLMKMQFPPQAVVPVSEGVNIHSQEFLNVAQCNFSA